VSRVSPITNTSRLSLDQKLSPDWAASASDATSKLPVRRLLLGVFLQSLSFLLLLRSKLLLVLDARPEASEVLLQQVAVVTAGDAKRLRTHTRGRKRTDIQHPEL